jgi:hypothetical protein
MHVRSWVVARRRPAGPTIRSRGADDAGRRPVPGPSAVPSHAGTAWAACTTWAACTRWATLRFRPEMEYPASG